MKPFQNFELWFYNSDRIKGFKVPLLIDVENFSEEEFHRCVDHAIKQNNKCITTHIYSFEDGTEGPAERFYNN